MAKHQAQLTPKAAAADLAAFAAQLRQRIEAQVSGFDPDPRQVTVRRARAMADFGLFTQTYFPHYIRSPHRSKLHDYLFERLPAIVASPKGQTDAIAAPRGEAKSTLVSQLFVLWCLVTGRKKYPVIVMDSIDQAYPMLEAIKAELEFNPRLALDFADVTGQGRVWQSGTIVTRNDAKVQVAGSGKKLRGLRHGPYRPDLCVLDDIENDEQVRSPEQRDKLQAWLSKTVLPLGAAGEKFDVVYIGTILHYDSVLSRTLANPLWTTARFKALLQWPDRTDLWDQWEALLRNDGRDAAQAFYDANEAAMLAGAVVSWAARSLLTLMTIRAKDGHATFDSEYQNDPVAGDSAPFSGEGVIKFWAGDLTRGDPHPSPLPQAGEGAIPARPVGAGAGDGDGGGGGPDLLPLPRAGEGWGEGDPTYTYFGACDPSLGKAGASRDPSALLVGRLNRSTGVLDVVAADIKKRLPDRIIEDVIALQRQWRCVLWVVETVQFQEFLRTELVKRSAKQGVPVPARAVQPIADKLLRIESLQPHMANGLIRLHPSQVTLIQQLRHFPKADHDDGPDALHMLWMAAMSGHGHAASQSDSPPTHPRARLSRQSARMYRGAPQ